MTQRWLQLAIVGIVFIFTPCLALAENPVLILVPASDDPDYAVVENRLRSELSAAGFSTETATVSKPLDSASLPANAARFSAPMAISITISNDTVFGLVYIANSGNGQPLIRAVPGYPVGEQAPSVFAVKATDVLHGALLELAHTGNTSSESLSESTSSAPKPPPREAQAPTQVQPSTSASRQPAHAPDGSQGRPITSSQEANWGVALGIKSSGGTRALPLTPGAELGIYRQQRHWGASINGSTFLPLTFTRAAGQARLSQWMLGASFQLFQPLPRTAFTVYESLGSGIYRLDVNGTGTRPQNSRQSSSTFGYTSLGLGLIVALGDRTGLAIGFGVLLPWKPADIAIQDEVVASLSFPVLLCDLGLRLAF